MPAVIKAENLSKAYQLGYFGTGTISRDLERYWAKIRGREDPFLKIGEENDRTAKGESDVVWSLKDISFEIEQGDAVGIIGRNGAGKSTLLKILSRLTAPTTGTVKTKGRVASLLEVGTGFHPELSGRENIYLNGAILGMRKAEIKRKLDDIIAFSGVERYVDTPVKRYSSGMYVRLAFAVAAHLESEILIVDEVLAVGDAEFQRKCLSKMGEVSKGEGRTVLFVSHNLAAVQKLCKTGLLLNNGCMQLIGTINSVTEQYTYQQSKNISTISESSVRYGSGKVQFVKFDILTDSSQSSSIVLTGTNIIFKFIVKAYYRCENVDIGFSIHDDEDNMHSVLYSSFQGIRYNLDPGIHEINFRFCDVFLSNRYYQIRGLIKENNLVSDQPLDPIGQLLVESGDFYHTGNIGHQSSKLTFLLKGEWT